VPTDLDHRSESGVSQHFWGQGVSMVTKFGHYPIVWVSVEHGIFFKDGVKSVSCILALLCHGAYPVACHSRDSRAAKSVLRSQKNTYE
jgi:hypothetical protein